MPHVPLGSKMLAALMTEAPKPIQSCLVDGKRGMIRAMLEVSGVLRPGSWRPLLASVFSSVLPPSLSTTVHPHC